jgi:serine protease Do
MKIDQREITDVHHLRKVVAWKKPGTSVKVSVFRDGKEFEITMPIGVLPERKLEIIPALDRFDDIGITVKNLTEELAYKWRIKEQSGVVVTRLKEYSPAFNAGMRVGDLIREIERKPIADSKDYKSIMTEHRERKQLLMLIQRTGVNKYVVVNRE